MLGVFKKKGMLHALSTNQENCQNKFKKIKQSNSQRPFVHTLQTIVLIHDIPYLYFTNQIYKKT